MPKKVNITPEEFARFDQVMLGLGFVRVAPEDIARDRERLGLLSRRRQERGSEVGYSFSLQGPNRLRVKVWTTWLENEGRFRKSDQGWVLIAQGDYPLHFVHPFNRTKNFLRRLKNHAEIEQQRVIRRPKCPHCNVYLPIVQGVRLKFRAWACQNIQRHPEQVPFVLQFNAVLSTQAKKYLEPYEKRDLKYRTGREEEGKPNYVALLRRKGSVITRSENVEG